jgi:hypothetical protein
MYLKTFKDTSRALSGATEGCIPCHYVRENLSGYRQYTLITAVQLQHMNWHSHDRTTEIIRQMKDFFFHVWVFVIKTFAS